MMVWLGHGPPGLPGGGYGYGGLVRVPFNVHDPYTGATSLKGPDGELPTFDTLGALMHPYRLAMRSPLYQC